MRPARHHCSLAELEWRPFRKALALCYALADLVDSSAGAETYPMLSPGLRPASAYPVLCPHPPSAPSPVRREKGTGRRGTVVADGLSYVVEAAAENPIHDSCRRASTKASCSGSAIASQFKLRAAASRRRSRSPSRAAICHHWSRSAVRSTSTRCLLCGGSCFSKCNSCSSVSDSVAMFVFWLRIAGDSTFLSAVSSTRLPPAPARVRCAGA